ncbi:lipocalin family protein [Aliiroseovarius sp. PrR006]|uniref:lipocalin family protein n=1 Tax=Aliiroseovarius sp. PrR006 TaxID=2706883 RepID=UPI0013D73B11|nr:lipocalin family protein [Aliiroseovarius sp. PrR006]NDW52557.1 lipocalin family protein [Aliiroseovarius sp. PrR006]
MIDRRTVLKLGMAAAAPSLVAACVSNGTVEFHRNTRRPISSTTRFDAKRFSGNWVIRGEFVHPGHAPLYGKVSIEHGAGGITGITLSNAAGGRERYDAQMKTPGRIIVGTPPFGTEYWVLWVDADYRTAAIGTPSGSFGWIIDRKRTGGADRIKAAADMLAFNGYTKDRLQTR